MVNEFVPKAVIVPRAWVDARGTQMFTELALRLPSLEPARPTALIRAPTTTAVIDEAAPPEV
jgi:hypothetical protein